MSDLMHGIMEILRNLPEYQEAEDFYEGNCEEIFASAKMRRALGNYGDEFSINLAKIPVDVIADRLEVAAITVPDDEASTAVLQEKVWDDNELLMACKSWTRKSSTFGDGYVFVWEDEDDENAVKVIFNNPKSTRLIYDEETETKPLYLVKLWREGEYFRSVLYYPDRIERYITAKDANPDDPNAWFSYAEGDDGKQVIPDETNWPVVNEYNHIPGFHLRNDTPYGKPEHRDAFHPQNIINKLVPSHMSSVDFQAFPQRYGIKEVNIAGSDEDDGLAWDEDDTNANISSQDRSKLKAGAGEMWTLEGYKAVGQFAAADPGAFMDPLAVYVRLLSVVTSTPLHYFDPEGGQPSGESRRAANEPTDKKAEDRQQRFGSTLSKAFSFALHIIEHRGTPVTKDNLKKVDIRWASPGTVSDLEGWNTIKLKVEAGLPLRFALLESGYTAEQCDSWGITESISDAPMKAQLELANLLATALSGLGAGVSFGVITEDDIRKIVDNVANATTEEPAA
jgi:hypothetical protein